MHALFRWLAICMLGSILAACGPSLAVSPLEPAQAVPAESIPWSYSDLRLLDPADAAQPEHDLLAVYVRHQPGIYPPGSFPPGSYPPRTHIRLDFLDLPIQNQTRLYLALDFTPGGTRQLPIPGSASLDWDVLVQIPAGAPVQAIDSRQQPVPNMAMRILRDPWMDSVQISFDPSALYPSPGTAAPPEIGVQVFTALPDASSIADQSSPTTSYAASPKPARTLLAFWNTFPAYTPAQALRRWDGAHSGPLGGRHGLSNLLRTASAHSIPIALLDLKTPAWISALDYAGDLELVDSLARRGLLLLPQVFPAGGSAALTDRSQTLAGQFDLPASPFAYTQAADTIPAGFGLSFIPASLPSPISTPYRWGDRRLLPLPFDLPSQPLLQPDLGGLSLEARRWMVNAALSANQQDNPPILVLGGDLTQATWGNPQIARLAFDYIAGHPWMQPADAPYLLSARPSVLANLPAPFEGAALPPAPLADPQLDLLTDSNRSASPLLEAAVQAQLALTPPSTPASPAFQDLLAVYQPQVQHLLEAARWAQDPQPQATCTSDIDQNGQAECVLASRSLYAVFDPTQGSLLYAFALTGSAAHQLIAPTSQLTFGRGGPASWDAQLGLAADPQVIPGAFSSTRGLPYQVELRSDQILFRHPQGESLKTFSLLKDGLRVEYQVQSPTQVSIPLVLDPWLRFYPGWGDSYQGDISPGAYSWEAVSGAKIEVRTSGQLQAYAFNATQESMHQVEDPNQEFPPGHYLPFPIAVVEISSDRDFFVEIRIY